MQVKLFTIPMHDDGGAEEEINSFLRAHRVLTIDRHFVQDGVNSVWAICISYLDANQRRHTASGKRPKVDYREVLSEPDFALFAKLRNLRKQMAEREAVPAYALFTNEHLAEMVRRKVQTASGLKEIEGVGEARVEKYGAAFLALLRDAAPVKPNGSAGGMSEAQQR